MSTGLVNLNTNPCKMCMPLGAVSAFYGVEKCMSILHGSQGCSTYIRRHMATHYNEPVDIASSSLTEEGTVFGGEKNLITGLDNLVRLYDPQVIGIATTCLAETIGEDVPSIVRRYYEKRPDCKVKIVSVASAGYAGTRYEGWFHALRALVSQVAVATPGHEGVNVITGPMSPADTRALKKLLEESGLACTVLPDISRNLDGALRERYNRLPSGGTPLADVERMGGARATIELATFCPEGASPGAYLREAFGVPLIRLNMPVGLRDSDAFLNAVRSLGGVIPEEVLEERGRCLDAMVDAHKYNATGRVAVYGEPDMLYGLVRLCCEVGMVPVVAATGADCSAMIPALEEEIRPVAAKSLVEKISVCNFADFEEIERRALENGANMLIGNSDGRRIAERHNLPLLRCGFPIHDHLGGQRIRMTGYSGLIHILTSAANAFISGVETTFREDLYERYYKEGEERAAVPEIPPAPAKTNAEKTKTHPCFSCSACAGSARIHLPVAPACNISCNYCVRDFDCPNESRPGVTSKVITPQEGLERFLAIKAEMPNLSVVGIAGPGDALANFDDVAETLRLIRREDPDITFCLSTNGLMLPVYADKLIELGVSHVTVTINAVDPAIGAKIYKHVTYMGTRYTGEQGATLLLANQLAGLEYLSRRGVVCKVNTVLLHGINEGHVEDVSIKAGEKGAYICNIMQIIPVKGSVFEEMPFVSNKRLMELRKQCEGHIRQMYHCRQCRADAVGLLHEDKSLMFVESRPVPELERPGKSIKIAVASRSGVVVDQHFGNADLFYIYESDGVSSKLLEMRSLRTPGEEGDFSCSCPGGGKKKKEDSGKILRAIEAVADCKGVLALRIGDSPMRRLKEQGIGVFATYDSIDKAVREAALKLCA